MKPRLLSLERVDAPVRAAVAWLIPSGAPEDWIAEIIRWRIDDSRCRIFLVPAPHDPSKTGAALITAADQTPLTTPAAAPFGVLAGRFYLPIDAVLRPAATGDELTQLFPESAVIFHPTLGTVACSRSVTLSELLQVPRELDEPFAHADDFRPPHPRIEAIGFRRTESFEEMIGGMRDDIARESPDDLPPATDEPSDDLLSRGGRKIREGGLRFLRWLFSGNRGSPTGSRRPGAFGRMFNWANQRLGALAEQLDKARNRAIHRLLEQLQKNPDDALKHALPIAQTGLHRGVAPPSADLGSRTPDFSLGNLRGGGPIDRWSFDADLQRQLRENYVRLAERERQLGRFRRAAYIYAELLGDFSSAAAALKEGQHWREAALLYRDHTRNPMAAAECFVQARMIAEAIAIYEKEHAYENLGLLYRQLNDEKRALEAFRAWVTQLIERQQRMRAADALLQHLDARDEALAVLEAAWPAGQEADACVDRCFALRAGAGEHEESRKLLQRLTAAPVPFGIAAPLVDVFARLQTSYPDRSIRALAEDLGRQQIAIVLRSGDWSRQPAFAHRLSSLAPDDRLLARDVPAFLDRMRPPRPIAPAKPATIESAMFTARMELAVPLHGLQWIRAVRLEESLLLIGITRDYIAACRVGFDGATQSCQWKLNSELPLVDSMFVFTRTTDRREGWLFVPQEALEMQTFGPDPQLGGEYALGTPAFAGDAVLAADANPAAVWLLRATATDFLVTGCNSKGALVGQIPIESVKDPEVWERFSKEWRWNLITIGTHLAVAMGNRLMLFPNGGKSTQTEVFDAPIMALVAGPRWAVPHFAVVLADRVALCWLGAGITVHLALGELEAPVAGFSLDGTLAIIAGEGGFLLDCDSRGDRKIARFAWHGTKPVAILPGPSARTFAVVEREGRISVWHFSAGDLK